MKKTALFFDVDGTLLNISKRFYAVYFDILKENNFIPLEFDKYWNLRKRNYKTAQIIGISCPITFIEEYYRIRNRRFESLEYLLKYDELIVELRLLNKLKDDGYALNIISLRENNENLIKELTFFKIRHYFDAILTGNGFGDYKTKVNLLKHIPKFESDFLIGDSEVDVLAAKELNIRSIAVESGIGNINDLKNLQPDFQICNVNDIYQILDKSFRTNKSLS